MTFELMSAYMRFCINLLDSYGKLYNQFIENFIKNYDKIDDKNNVVFFNGYLFGYEQCKKDYDQLIKKKSPSPDPAHIYF